MRRGSGFFCEVDELTLERARRGDLAALESIYRAFESPVFTLARRLCSTDDAAADVLQETFVEVIRSVRRFRGDGAFGAWLRRITASKALIRLRRARSRRQHEAPTGASFHRHADDPSNLEPGPPALDERLDLERALSALTVTARAVVWLHDVEGFTHAEIGELMGRTASFSKSQLARAHVRLRSLLGRDQGMDHEASDHRRSAGVS